LAILVAQALALVSATSTVGEIGALFWIALGLVLASPKSTAKLPSQIDQVSSKKHAIYN
jgi:hypothetical protein